MKGELSLKTYRTFRKNVFVVLMAILSIVLVVGCASKKKPTQSEMMPPVSSRTEPTIIELDDARLDNALKEGDIPEEDRGDLAWLPKRPPQGMRFGETSALQTVYFEFDKYSLTTQARNILNTNADWLKNHPEISVQIEGHCDERGTLEYNQVLGENRAINVKKYLVTLGVNPNRVYTISYGELRPADSGHNEDVWAKNRRAQFKVSQ